MEQNKDILTNEEMQEELENENYELEEYSGSSTGKKVVVATAVVAGIAGLVKLGKSAYDKYVKPKADEKRAENLRKAGYVVFKEEDCEVREVECDSDEVAEADSEE